MINNILKEVQSPFSDELIKFLIESYVQCGLDDNLFYEKINNLNVDSTTKDNNSLGDLINQIYKHGISAGNLWNYKGPEPKLIYDINSSWVILKSEEDPMKDKTRGERPLLYRVYLNLNGTEKTKFITEYLAKCKEQNMPYEFKFSKEESRKDQVIILSRIEELEKNISLIEELTSNMNLGELPLLVGKYKNNIGIGEEYYNRLYSPTTVRLALIRSSVKKYLLDHKDEFDDKLTESEKDEINNFEKVFKYKYEHILFKMNVKGNSYKDRENEYQKKCSIDCAKEHIENESDAYCCGDGLKGLKGIVEKIYLDNQGKFLKEITKNYRTIGNEVWGISKDFIFSVDTENKFLQREETNLNQENEYEVR